MGWPSCHPQHPSPASAPPEGLQAVCCHPWDGQFNSFPVPVASSPTQPKRSLSYPDPSCLMLRGREPAVPSRWLPLGQRGRGQSRGTRPGYRALPRHPRSNRVWGFLASQRGSGSPHGSAPSSCCHPGRRSPAGAPCWRFIFHLSIFSTILKSVLCWRGLGKEKEKKSYFPSDM